uniref:MHC class I-like antigen recognition-like domain-containing protein n=1 Tax=Balaenoptera musculus TaxID=9771 RepID=A0A8C0CDY3_BALMU
MLLLPLLLLAVVVPGGDNEDAFQGPTSYHVIQISTFANSTWAQNQGSGWLDDFQIHGWDSDSGTFTICLKPWSRGNFSDAELIELEDLFQAYFIGFTQEVQDYASKFQIECEYSPLLRGDSQRFFSLLVKAITLLESFMCACTSGQQQGAVVLYTHYSVPLIWGTIVMLLSETCPRYLLGVLDAGKVELQRQEHLPSLSLIFLAISVPSLVLLLCLALWFLRHW